MIDWGLFGRMLGIPEQVAEPTVYQLLGLTDPRTITPELVEHALNERKKLLRQNIPGPQFIPIVALFEKELDRAAGILLDSGKRNAYHERILREAHGRRKVLKARSARQRLIRAAREVIRAALSQDGTLEDERRPALAGRLRAIGVPAPDIQQVLAQIPRPTPETTRPTDQEKEFFVNAVDLAIRHGLLTKGDERKLSDLADKLHIPRDAATRTINHRLEASGARRGERDAAFLKARFAEQVRRQHPDRRCTEQQRANLLALAASQGVPADVAREVLTEHLEPAGPPLPREGGTPASDAARGDDADEIQEILQIIDDHYDRFEKRRPRVPRAVWQVGIPGAAIVIFSLFFLVYHDAMSEQKAGPAPQPPALQQSSDRRSQQPESERPSDETPPVTEPGVAEPTHTRSGTEPPPMARPRDPIRPILRDPGPAPLEDRPSGAPAREPEPPVRRDVGTSFTKQLRGLYSSGGTADALLTDVALTMLAGCAKAGEFADVPGPWSAELSRLITSLDPSAELTLGVTVPAEAGPISLPAAPPAKDSDSIDALRKQITSASPEARYPAIEELRILNSPAAADVLLTALEGGARKSLKTSCRILRALRTMSDPSIPRRLVEVIPKSHPQLAYLIVQALIEETGVYARGGARLPFKHNRGQLEGCVRWWDGKQKQGRLVWGAGRSYRPDPDLEARDAGARPWQPDPLPARLIAATADYATQTTGILHAYHWEENAANNEGGPDPEPLADDGADLAATLLAALDALVDQLSRLVREHPDGESHAVKADVAELERDTRALACDTALQKAAVSLDAAGRLLELLVQESDAQGQRESTLEAIRRQREAAISDAPDVIHEIRECAYYDLVLWDLLCQVNE